MNKEQVKDVIQKRIDLFQSKYHTHEAIRLTSALKAIEELIPPDMFIIEKKETKLNS